MTKRVALTVSVLTALAGFLAGTNAAVIANAVYVSRATGAPFYRVLDPLHRPWLQTSLDAVTVPAVADDENTNEN